MKYSKEFIDTFIWELTPFERDQVLKYQELYNHSVELSIHFKPSNTNILICFYIIRSNGVCVDQFAIGLTPRRFTHLVEGV
nr:MAG TPA: hypothetical protein [Caudoviricetes sp.]